MSAYRKLNTFGINNVTVHAFAGLKAILVQFSRTCLKLESSQIRDCENIPGKVFQIGLLFGVFCIVFRTKHRTCFVFAQRFQSKGNLLCYSHLRPCLHTMSDYRRHFSQFSLHDFEIISRNKVKCMAFGTL